MKKTSSNTGARSKAARRGRPCISWEDGCHECPPRSTSTNVVPPNRPIKGSGMVASPTEGILCGNDDCHCQSKGTVAPTTPALTARGRGRTGSGDDTDSRLILGKDRSW